MPIVSAHAQTRVPSNDSYLKEGSVGNLKENISKYAHIERDGDKGTITLHDSDIIKALDESGYDVSSIPTTFADGQTKVDVISWSNGDADIYLSKGFLNTTSSAGLSAITAALGSLLPGAGWAAAIGAISGALGAQSFENGKVFQIRGFSYQGSYDQ
ncbi:MAG: hypothetical protein Q4A55_00775 [Aerococcus sp.]|nr:hypothetical protein [Aerococcus sp.]